MLTSREIAARFETLQDSICTRLEALDGRAKFAEDPWKRPGGGGGRTRVISHGNLLEKGGVNFSAVHGDLPPLMQKHFGVEEATFFATGVSIVLHPAHPLVPIIHMNVRYFEMSDGKRWFGGGIDLTPHYVVEEDAQFFHQQLKRTCDAHPDGDYDRFKEWADDYFFIPHRDETRGVGGIFFDHLMPEDDVHLERLFDYVVAVGETFAPTYEELARRHMHKPFTEAHKEWQRIRRGRYVEFNLVYDRGTKFGLETNGRIESILMSLPEHASWMYNHQPEEGSQERRTLDLLKKGVDWIGGRL